MSREIFNDFLIGKWSDRITCDGWHLLRLKDMPEQFVWRIVSVAIFECGEESSADILHEAYGCKRVPFNRELEDIRVIPISLENALRNAD